MKELKKEKHNDLFAKIYLKLMTYAKNSKWIEKCWKFLLKSSFYYENYWPYGMIHCWNIAKKIQLHSMWAFHCICGCFKGSSGDNVPGANDPHPSYMARSLQPEKSNKLPHKTSNNTSIKPQKNPILPPSEHIFVFSFNY